MTCTFSSTIITTIKKTYNELLYIFYSTNSTDWLSLSLLLFAVLSFIAIIGSAFAFLLLWPLLLVWAINTLFGTTVPLTFTTWVAVLMLFYGIKLIGGTFKTTPRRK